jgi:hypothetical protein
MGAWWAVPAVVAATGCGLRGVEVPPTPIPTDGPNQVVIYVPAMT